MKVYPLSPSPDRTPTTMDRALHKEILRFLKNKSSDEGCRGCNITQQILLAWAESFSPEPEHFSPCRPVLCNVIKSIFFAVLVIIYQASYTL